MSDYERWNTINFQDLRKKIAKTLIRISNCSHIISFRFRCLGIRK